MFRELYRELRKLLSNIAEEPWPIAIVITTILLMSVGMITLIVGFLGALLIKIIAALPQILLIPAFIVGVVWLIKRYFK